MKKGLDRCFLQYGIRMEDMQIIEQLCRDNDIEPEWFKENILKAYQEERSKEFDAWRKGLNNAAPAKAKKNAERTLRLVFNDEAWDSLYTYRSEPLTFVPGRKVAVRVVSQFGEESTKVLTME